MDINHKVIGSTGELHFFDITDPLNSTELRYRWHIQIRCT